MAYYFSTYFGTYFGQFFDGNAAGRDVVDYTLHERPVRVQVRSGELQEDGGGSFTQVWVTREEIMPLATTLIAASVGQARGTFVRRYGAMRAPTAAAFGTVAHEDLTGKWIRVQANHPTGDPPVDDWRTYWVGLIVKQVDQPDNRGISQTATGDSELTAVGPEYLLRMSRVDGSWWKLPDYNQPQELGWTRSFNRTLGGDRLVGNRGGNYLGVAHFGDNGRWNHRQMVEYVIARHVQQYRDAVYATKRWPVWTIDGPGLNALQQIESEVAVRDVDDAERLLRSVVAPELGFDFAVLPTDTGFELRIFQLEPYRNAETWDVDTYAVHNLQVRIERSTARLYDRVMVLGKRIVVALSGDGAGGAITGREIIPRWTLGQETAYKAATGTDDAEKNDAFRADDRFRDVYQAFAFRRSEWPFVSAVHYWPSCDAAGQIQYDSPGQIDELDTLPALPLRDGYDYGVNPPVYNGDAADVPALRQPLALVRLAPAGPWVPVDQLATVQRQPGQVTPLRGAVGLRVNFAPNHVLAGGRWSGAQASAFDPDLEGFAASDLVITLAVESDHRVRVMQLLPEAERANLGQTMVVEMPEAELHIVLPGTVVGVNADGTLRTSPGLPMVIRDDRLAMQAKLNEAITRYLAERARTTVRYDRLEDATDAPGKLLRVAIAPAGSFDEISAVTTVEYDWQTQRTTIMSGQAVRG